MPYYAVVRGVTPHCKYNEAAEEAIRASEMPGWDWEVSFDPEGECKEKQIEPPPTI